MSGWVKYIIKVNLAILIVIFWIAAAFFAIPLFCATGRCAISISSFLTL